MERAGYFERLSTFAIANDAIILEHLRKYICDADNSQIVAWKDSISILKREVNKLVRCYEYLAENSSIILEYTIPLESRRIDAVILLNQVVSVIEFKGKERPLLADIDQAAAYARDLRAYHKECSKTPVKCLLIPVRMKGDIERVGEVDIIEAKHLSSYCGDILSNNVMAPNIEEFLSFESYRPLPSLIKAARELFKSGTLTRIHRAATATEPTIKECSAIIRETAKKKRRALILIGGVPGAGKTLVGLQLAHAKYLDDLSIVGSNGEKSTAPAVFLSGNGPLVEVLQYELRSAGGDGKAFVRGVHEYVKTFTRAANLVPPQHVLIYDEAQRAFDADQVQAKHKNMPKEFQGLSEPELFIRFAECVPDWCVVVGLIGSGQEIHIGEEAGIGQWKTAIDKAGSPDIWDIYIFQIMKK